MIHEQYTLYSGDPQKGTVSLTIPELAEQIGVTVRSVERNIQQLQKNHLLQRIGPSNGWSLGSFPLPRQTLTVLIKKLNWFGHSQFIIRSPAASNPNCTDL